LYQHRPGMYHLMQGEVVPRLSKLKVGAPGVNGVGQDAAGNADARPAIAQALENGNKIIPWDVDGPATSYIRRPKGMPHVHLSKWEKPFPGSNIVHSDEVGFVKWLVSLVERGILPPCPLHVLQGLLANKQREWDTLIERPNYAQSSAHDRLKSEIAVLEDEIATHEDSAGAETEIPEPPAAPSDEPGVKLEGSPDDGDSDKEN